MAVVSFELTLINICMISDTAIINNILRVYCQLQASVAFVEEPIVPFRTWGCCASDMFTALNLGGYSHVCMPLQSPVQDSYYSLADCRELA